MHPQIKASQYLEQHRIYPLFSNLISSLAIHRPASPISFLIEQLSLPDACRICVVSNNRALSERCSKLLSDKLNVNIYTPNIDSNEMDGDQIQTLQSERNFILQNYPQTRSQAIKLLESKVIPDRAFLITNQSIETLSQDKGQSDMMGLNTIFKHNARIVCCLEDQEDAELEKVLIAAYKEERNSVNSTLLAHFPPRVCIVGPPNANKTKLSLCLKEMFGVTYLNAAQVMKRHIEMHTELGVRAEQAISEKQMQSHHFFVDNTLVVDMMAHDVFTDKSIMTNGYVLDNFPRTETQAQCMVTAGMTPNRVIVLKASDATVIEKGGSSEYVSGEIETPGVDYASERKDGVRLEALLNGYKQSAESIKEVLCGTEKVSACDVLEFDVDTMDWERLTELACDFIKQPLPNQ